VDLYLKILELGLDARTWVDYIVQQTRETMKHEANEQEMTDIASGVMRLSEKVEDLKRLLDDYMVKPAAVSGPRQYSTVVAAEQAYRADDGYPSDTLLGKYYAVGTPNDGYDIQFLTRELSERSRAEHPDWEIIELKKR
jgi:hypothetical protein